MKVIIKNIGNGNFTLNGVEFQKIFLPIKTNTTTFKVVSIYDSRFVLIDNTSYNDVEINSVTFPNVDLVIYELSSLLYSKIEVNTAYEEQFKNLEKTVNSISAGEGGKSYATLADAQAVDPKPSDGTIFQVEESTNAGYHKFDSLQTGGTKFVKPFPVNKDDISLSESVNNILNPSYLENGSLNSLGQKGSTSANSRVLMDLPLSAGQYTLSGYIASSGKILALVDVNGTLIGQTNTLSASTLTFDAPVDCYLRVTLKEDTDPASWGDSIMLNTGNSALTYEPYVKAAKSINDNPLEAKALSSGNKVPNPVNPLNALNKDYFDKNAVKNSDLITEPSSNLAKEEYKIEGMLISNTGSKSFSSGWVLYRIPVTPGKQYTFGNFTIDSSGYAAFYDATDDPTISGNAGLVSYEGNHNNASSIPKTVTAPANAAWLYIDVSRPTNTAEQRSLTIINEGAILLPYEVPTDIIKKISGKRIKGGGTDYDQSLNSTDNVSFNSVNTSEITTSVLIANLPEGANEPAGLELGQAWLDTANGNVIKVKTV